MACCLQLSGGIRQQQRRQQQHKGGCEDLHCHVARRQNLWHINHVSPRAVLLCVRPEQQRTTACSCLHGNCMWARSMTGNEVIT